MFDGSDTGAHRDALLMGTSLVLEVQGTAKDEFSIWLHRHIAEGERIAQIASDADARGRARHHILARHSLASAADTLRNTLAPMIA